MSRGIFAGGVSGTSGSARIATTSSTSARTAVRRVAGAAVAGVAMAGAVALATPMASAGDLAVHAAEVAGTAVRAVPVGTAQVALPVAASVVPHVGDLTVPEFGRHEVSTPQVIGESALVGAGVGAVAGFGLGVLFAPAVGLIVTGATPIVGPIICVGLTMIPTAGPFLGAGCGVATAILTAVGGPIATVATPFVGAAIGAAIGAGVGAGIGASYASAPAQVQVADKGTTPIESGPVERAVAPIVAAQPVLKRAQPTIDNVTLAADRALDTVPQLAPIAGLVNSLVPQAR